MSQVSEIVREIGEAKSRRIEAERMNPCRVSGRMIRVMSTLRARVVDGHMVAVSVTDTRDGRGFGYLAAEILDSAASRVDIGDNGLISEVSRTEYMLTF
ncbi:hypothetical protein QTQ03_02050 [Micromonospora sp. WMMA1363]|uniref:hypothetical protein n=1 Tax=Micromonospora sp. WMMA1363 TaxID=3053985 RepID=UPI00259CBDE1|nr:hypothetical protein [Micromonospora sp. WMMA1363]MDM4718432.1 hypothetical protein [Micromonospora sp. WMMA1363]